MAPLETASSDLRALLRADVRAPEWRWNVRRHLSLVREALAESGGGHVEAWLSAREGVSVRQRLQLLARVNALAAGVLDRFDLEVVVSELRRLSLDLEHHVQRVHDLVYDSVALELGGSE